MYIFVCKYAISGGTLQRNGFGKGEACRQRASHVLPHREAVSKRQGACTSKGDRDELDQAEA